MAEGPLRAVFRAGWARPWLRRTAYVLVAGALLAGSSNWVVRQPFTLRWVVKRLDALSREQTGLGLDIQGLELHLNRGRLVLRGIRWGEDLLQVEAIELQARFRTLLSHSPVVDSLEIRNPKIQLDATRLAKLRFKPRDPDAPEVNWNLGRIRVLGGRLEIREAAWGLQEAWADFTVEGHGVGPQRLMVNLKSTQLQVNLRGAAQVGKAEFQATAAPEALELRSARFELGQSQVKGQGRLELKGQQAVASKFQGSFDLDEVGTLLQQSLPVRGRVGVEASLSGSLGKPVWSFLARGQELQVPALGPQPVILTLQVEGQQDEVRVRSLRWESPQGAAEAAGTWSPRSGAQGRFQISHLPLVGLAGPLHLPFLARVGVQGQGDLVWKGAGPESLSGQLALTFTEGASPAGRLQAHFEKGRLNLPLVNLQFQALEAQASGVLHFGRRGLRGVEAEGSVRTDAAEVAKALKDWKVTDLDMSGRVSAKTQVAWSPQEGFSLEGEAEIDAPRWHGAKADRLRAGIAIQRSELQIRQVELEKGAGRAFGELWLTWRDQPRTHDQIDFCFRAQGLPIKEGLGAADLARLDIDGNATGWIRARGPYDRLQLQGSVLAQEAKVYGLDIPAASADFDWNLEGNRLKLQGIRVAGNEAQLLRQEEGPSGLLDLSGQADLDFSTMTLRAQASGALDSQLLGLPGPRIQARFESRLDGAIADSVGPLGLPEGVTTISGGRVFFGTQSVEGLEGRLESGQGGLDFRVGFSGFPESLARLVLLPEGKNLKGALDVRMDPQAADTAHLAPRLTQDLLQDGRLTLQAEGRWDESGWDWRGRLEELSGRFDGFDLSQARPSELWADGRHTEVDLLLEGRSAQEEGPTNGARMHVSGELPFSSSEPLRLRLEGQADLAQVKQVVDHLLTTDPFSLMAELQPAGTALLDLSLGGSYLDPQVDGSLKLEKGRLRAKTFLQSMEDLSADLRFRGREIFISEANPLRGRLAQGDLRAWGKMRWQLGGIADYELRTKVDDFQLRDVPEGFDLQGSVDATLTGVGERGGQLKGTIVARRAAYHADLNLTDFLLNSSLRGASGLSALDPENPLDRIKLDLDLQLLQPWIFDTNLLKLQGQPAGPFKIQGSLTKPGLWGRMEFLPGGQITNLLPAGDVKVERGFIQFSDPRFFNPFINVEGRIDVSPYLVTLNIRGTLDSMDLRPSSTPSLRQDEIIAILLDPSAVSNVGTGVGNSTQNTLNVGLVQTGSNLITGLALANLQEGLRRTLNLDRVTFVFRPGAAGTESTLSVGKSLDLFGRRMPVIYTRRKAGEITTQSLQWELRLGNLVVQFGTSQTAPEPAGLSGEIRHTWSPK